MTEKTSLKKSMVALDKELSKNVTMTESNICEHENTVMTFAMDCIRYIATSMREIEQTIAMDTHLSM